MDLISVIPGGHRFARSIAWGWIILWYAGLVLAIAARGVYRKIAGAALLLISMTGILYPYVVDDKVFIDILDVGHGQAAVIDFPGPDYVMIDTGPAYTSWKVLRHLREQGVNKLKAIVLSHPDSRHMGATPEIMAAFPVAELWVEKMEDKLCNIGLCMITTVLMVLMMSFEHTDGGVLF